MLAAGNEAALVVDSAPAADGVGAVGVEPPAAAAVLHPCHRDTSSQTEPAGRSSARQKRTAASGAEAVGGKQPERMAQPSAAQPCRIGSTRRGRRQNRSVGSPCSGAWLPEEGWVTGNESNADCASATLAEGSRVLSNANYFDYLTSFTDRVQLGVNDSTSDACALPGLREEALRLEVLAASASAGAKHAHQHCAGLLNEAVAQLSPQAELVVVGPWAMDIAVDADPMHIIVELPLQHNLAAASPEHGADAAEPCETANSLLLQICETLQQGHACTRADICKCVRAARAAPSTWCCCKPALLPHRRAQFSPTGRLLPLCFTQMAMRHAPSHALSFHALHLRLILPRRRWRAGGRDAAHRGRWMPCRQLRCAARE